ncbi:hypothetical protein [Candidatus Nitrospira nitrificans]|uniref:Uncharacterized protein n=1 Tax=Candidatus Nitrospira nitrificans TaxID=1742973 RepID=A0A0S4L8R6_9BACT|nr:hypothetical protein [Candidatus Nitrospira nitrificans]CUS32989.1 conserved exported hypothetical protein [Candidatus Nitrospira nitrificans]
MKAAQVLVALSLACLGCATPPEVKQAVIAKDQAYTENQRLMEQYRELVTNVTERHHQWYRHVQTRLKLNLALQWATTNPKLTDVADAELAKDDAELLGAEVIALINDIRLKNLPERKGPDGQVVFQAGTGDMSNLLQKLPELTGRIAQRIEKDAQASANVDLTAFDQYGNNVGALRRINAILKQYLDIDVTVSRDEVQSLAEAVRTLRR